MSIAIGIFETPLLKLYEKTWLQDAAVPYQIIRMPHLLEDLENLWEKDKDYYLLVHNAYVNWKEIRRIIEGSDKMDPFIMGGDSRTAIVNHSKLYFIGIRYGLLLSRSAVEMIRNIKIEIKDIDMLAVVLGAILNDKGASIYYNEGFRSYRENVENGDVIVECKTFGEYLKVREKILSLGSEPA